MSCPHCKFASIENHIEFGMFGYRCLRCDWIWFDNSSVSYQMVGK